MSVDTIDTTTTTPAVDTAAFDAEVTAFETAAKAAVADKDPGTGTLTEGQLEPVKVAYRAISGGIKYKNQAKKFVADSMVGSLAAGVEHILDAVAWNSIKDAIAVAPKGEDRKPGVTPTKAYADKVQSLRIALDLVEGDQPEGVEDDWSDEISDEDNATVAEAYLAWVNGDAETRGDEPEVSAVVKAAVKLATGKGPKKAGRPAGAPFGGVRRDVAAHITNAFANLNSGDFLTISEIRNIESPEYGPDDAPSAGAISARLFPKNDKPVNIEGVTPGTNDKGVNGAFKS